eukprot:1876923-Pleurochrysis_carterae.AAC.2
MLADSWRSQDSARFEALGACRAGRPDATPTLQRGASVPHCSSAAQPILSPSLSPRVENAPRGMVGGESFSLARLHGGDAIVRARHERERWLRAM